MAGAPQLAAAQAPAPELARLRLKAEQLRREQRLPAALDAYRAVVEQEPGSFEDRFWVAKLESWTGRLPAADSGLVRLLAERPDDYDSRIALADVRLWRGDTAASGELLDRLRRDYPDDLEVRQRLGALAGGERRGRWEADFEYFGERLPGVAAANGAGLSLAARRSERLRWRAAAMLQEKFDRTESRAGGEIGFRPAERLEVAVSVFLAPGAEVLPSGSYGLGASHRLARGVVLYGDYTHLRYQDAHVHQVGPAVELYHGRWLVTGRFRWAATRYAGATAAVHDAAGTLAVGYLYGERSLVRVFGAAGGESFTQPSRELIGRFEAHTLGLSWRHFLTPGFGVEALYAHQERSGGTDGDSWSLRVLRRW
ncbi:MAG TPA: YaiO family outer membrane beta-barrel protein [Gemmatimonadales bacterium]